MKNSGSEETFVIAKWFMHFSLLVHYSDSNARKNLVCANKVLLVLRQRERKRERGKKRMGQQHDMID